MADTLRAVALAPPLAAAVARGLSRLLFAEGYTPIVDVADLGAEGTIVGIEIKVRVADVSAATNGPIVCPPAISSISLCSWNSRKICSPCIRG
jgi:hypothetical protein